MLLAVFGDGAVQILVLFLLTFLDRLFTDLLHLEIIYKTRIALPVFCPHEGLIIPGHPIIVNEILFVKVFPIRLGRYFEQGIDIRIHNITILKLVIGLRLQGVFYPVDIIKNWTVPDIELIIGHNIIPDHLLQFLLGVDVCEFHVLGEVFVVFEFRFVVSFHKIFSTPTGIVVHQPEGILHLEVVAPDGDLDVNCASAPVVVRVGADFSYLNVGASLVLYGIVLF